jgi:hypothetical protein
MWNEYDGQAGVGGQIGEQKFENFQPARGGPNPGHRNNRPGRYVLSGRLAGEPLAFVHNALPSNRGALQMPVYPFNVLIHIFNLISNKK